MTKSTTAPIVHNLFEVRSLHLLTLLCMIHDMTLPSINSHTVYNTIEIFLQNGKWQSNHRMRTCVAVHEIGPRLVQEHKKKIKIIQIESLVAQILVFVRAI